MARLRHLPLLASAVVLTGCVQTHFSLATHKQEYSLTSTAKEVAIGRRVARKVEDDLPILLDESIQARVRAIGERIVAVCDRHELVYRFTAIDQDDVNAFSLPGGYIYVFRGLIEHAESDDELAAVLAHEVAHVTARHSVKRYQAGLGMSIVQLASLATKQGAAMRGLSIGMQAARLTYARQDELEADRIGVRYLQDAGFDATGMLSLLETIHALDQKKRRYLPSGMVRPQYALTHPFAPERIRTVKEALYGVADYLDYLNTEE